MGFRQAIAACFSKYADFHGRAARPEYWWFALFNALASILASIVDKNVIGDVIGVPVVQAIVALALVVPTVAVAVRRLHDTDRSGWWLLIAFVPLIGAILLLVWFCSRGTTASNRFGAEPQAA